MQRWRRMCAWLMLGMGVLLGCSPSGKVTLPTIGPKSTAGGYSDFRIDLISSTNCAKIGEVITFTVRLNNLGTQPVTLTGTPVVDILIDPIVSTNAPPTQRWSATRDYPIIPPLMESGEIRTYEWSWQAEAKYAVHSGHTNGIQVTVPVQLYEYSEQYINKERALMRVGVHSMDWGEFGVNCADMPR